MPEPKASGVRERREPGFYIIDNEIISRFGRHLGVYGIAVYNELKRRCWGQGQNTVELSQREIGRWIGAHQKTVGRMLRRLRDLGLIDFEPVDPVRPDLGYEIVLEDVKALIHQQKHPRRPRRRGAPYPGAHGATLPLTPAPTAPPNKEVRTDRTDRLKTSRAARENLTPATAAGALMARWLSIKQELQEQLPAERWIRSLYLLRAPGNVLQLALPPNRKIQEAAIAHKAKIQHCAQWGGFAGAVLTTYPDQYQLDRLAREYPEIYAQFLGGRKRAARAAAAAVDKRTANGGGE